MSPKPPDGTKDPPNAETDPAHAGSPSTSTPRNKSSDKITETETEATHEAATASADRVAGATSQSPAARERTGGINKKHHEPPTLLADFLMGRPSPQRIAAQRLQRRRQSLDAVKAEMRQASVRKIQQPGGVRDRVKQWQRSNAAVAAVADPSATPTEPSDVAVFSGAEDSVTEEDRVRIKMRQRKKSSPPIMVHELAEAEGKKSEDSHGDSRSGSAEAESKDSRSKGPPKRVVSDTNWMAKKGKKSPPRSKMPPKTASPDLGSGGQPLPKNFLEQQPVVKEPMSRRVQDWAAKVELPESPTPTRHTRHKSGPADDGIRVKATGAAFEDLAKKPVDHDKTPTPLRKKRLDTDGIRVVPIRTKLADNETRARPERNQLKTGSSLHEDDITVEEDESDDIEVIEDPDSCLDTPTKRRARDRLARESRGRTLPKSQVNTVSDESSWVSSDDSALKTGLDESELGSSVLTSAVGAKSLADIPVGYSAFSDLDLPAGAKAHHPPRPQRNPSFKGMPNVFKKVMAEGKKILSEAAEPPKPTGTNKPPSIEKWLNGTVDPFVENQDGQESPRSRPQSLEKDATRGSNAPKRSSEETKRRSSPPPRTELTESTGLTGTTGTTDFTETTFTTENDENREPTPEPEDSVHDVKTPPSTGLKRRSATRASYSPIATSGKKTFREALKEAFRGESGTHKFTPKRYTSCEQRHEPEYDSYSYSGYDDDYSGLGSDQNGRAASSDSWTDETSSVGRDETPTMAGPRRKPPTTGVHELSTIAGSVDDYSNPDSDVTSHVSDTTVTQSTALTKDTEVSRQQSHKSGSGLKRRLTKHSDLVSVLSLPDDKQALTSLQTTRSRPSLRKKNSHADSVTVNDLLQEFVDDENLYQRELKTLVDGVIPVLLTNVLGDRQSAVNLFGPESPGSKASAMSKSVVNMGIALEKMKNAHRKASHSDIDRLISWMQGVVPIYDSYLDAWRLGFQDLVVNLLPAAGKLDDEDSLIGALPRNAEGDVINENGERVDVAHLLKRPILRIKLLTKWAAGVHMLLSSYDTLALSGDFQVLQEKARRRQKEESARLADQDAIDTDTSRTRDLRTLAPLSSVKIDPNKQVNAKDIFSLNLAHSNGQRLECQVELVHRDNVSKPNDRGDVLIREMGDGRRTWLLFPPAPWSAVSARRGDSEFELVAMIQGSHNGKSWYELLMLSTDNYEQVEDWLDILGTTPVPHLHRTPSVIEEPPSRDSTSRAKAVDVPVGGRLRTDPAYSRDRGSPEPASRPETPEKRPTTNRHSARGTSLPSVPTFADPYSAVNLPPETTPARKAHDEQRREDDDRSRPLRESMRPEPLKLKKPAPPNQTPARGDRADRADEAPPPPVHRDLGSKSSKPSKLSKASPDLKSAGVKRRTSSPLKREYLPSDDSSVTEGSYTGDSETDSSEDDFEDDLDVPETELGYSIKDQPEAHATPNDSVVSESIVSLTPSNSASQAGLHGRKMSLSEGYTKYIASLSHWSDRKGTWKDISEEPCSVVVGPGVVEVYALVVNGASAADQSQPIVRLDLTPLVLLRQSTVVDLEIRSAIQENCQLKHLGGGNFRFRCPSSAECYNLYMAVHQARLNNQKFIQLENEARFKQFGERQAQTDQDDGSSSKRRSWFGRKNSYRASTRAPSQSYEGASNAPSSSVSASSFLRRLTGGGNLSFNIARSSVDKQSQGGSGRHPGSAAGGGSGSNSMYGSSSSSSGANSPRAPSMYSSARTAGGQPLSSDNIRIRLHLLVTPTKWEDYGNCSLQIRRPPPGWHQELRANHGLEKRVTVTTMPRKDSEQPKIVLDAVLGSGCFTAMGSRGVVCGVWEEMKGANGEVGVAPATGIAGGSVKKWCFQCASVAEAGWVLRLVHQEVMGGLD